MGWDYAHYKDRQELVDEITSSYETDKSFTTCLEYRAYPRILWSVWEKVDKTTGKASRYIGCDLIQGGDGYYGHKSMCEAMGQDYQTYFKSVYILDTY